jgi:hypothetical protein
MTKRITIAFSVTFFGMLLIIVAIVWRNSATAQSPLEPKPLPSFPGSERAAICATNDYVYVLSGNMLYQFNASDLKLIRKTPIEEEPHFLPGKPGIMEDKFPPSRKTPKTER